MVPDAARRMLLNESEEAIETFLEDESCVFWVDWRGDDDGIVEDCESVLRTGDLSAEIVSAENELGFDLYIAHRGERVRTPLEGGCGDRHITLYTLKQLLSPQFEIRLCVDSLGGDTIAFLPLAARDWSKLEGEFGDKVAKHFQMIHATPNLFTE